MYCATVPDGFENPYMIFTFNEKEYKVTEYSTDAKGRKCFKFLGVNPQCMGDNICATVYATAGGTEVSYTYSTYSVRQYCVGQFGKNPDTLLKSLLSDLLVYGKEAQLYQDYKTDALVTTDVEIAPSTFTVLGDEYNKQSTTGEKSELADWSGVSLYLTNNAAIRYTIKTSSPEEYTYEITIKGKTTTFSASNLVYASEGKYYLYFDGIMATEFDEPVTAVIKQGATQVGRTFVYSVNTYIQKNQNDTGQLGAMLKAIYNYGQSAKLYAE